MIYEKLSNRNYYIMRTHNKKSEKVFMRKSMGRMFIKQI